MHLTSRLKLFFFFWQFVYEGVSKSFRTESITKSTTTTNTRWEVTHRFLAAKLTRLTHKIAIQLHLVAESCTICNSAPGGQYGNFGIHPRIKGSESVNYLSKNSTPVFVPATIKATDVHVFYSSRPEDAVSSLWGTSVSTSDRKLCTEYGSWFLWRRFLTCTRHAIARGLKMMDCKECGRKL
jgi:hypothetical protein